MSNNNRFLKTLLTTVSTLAIATGMAGEAFAVVNSPTNTSGSVGGSGWTADGVFSTGDSILLTPTYYNVQMVNGAVTNIAAIDAGGVALSGSTINAVNQWATGISIGSIGDAASGTMGLLLYDGVSISLTGTSAGEVAANDYSALGPVRLGSSVDGSDNPALTPSVLNITATGAVTFGSAVTINSYTEATANWGTLNISGANHVFNGVIGGTSKLGAINITDAHNITFSANVTSNTMNIANGATLVFNSTSEIHEITGAIDGAAAGNGTLNITLAGGRGSTYTRFNSNIGSTNRLSSVSFGTNTGTYMQSLSINTNSLSIVDGASIFNLGATTVNGNATIGTTTEGVGTCAQGGSITTSGTMSVIGNIEIDNGIQLIANGEGGVDLTGNTNFYHWGGDIPSITSANGINMNGHNLTAQGSQTITGNLRTTGNGDTGGTFAINGGDVTLVGSIGGVANILTGVHFASDNILTINGTHDIYGYITPSVDGQGTLKLSGGTTTLHHNIGDYTKGYNSSALALRAMNVNDQTLVIDSTVGNFYVSGQITTTTNSKGTLTTQGANTVTLFDNIGSANALAAFNVNASTILHGETINTGSIILANNKTLTIDSTSAARSITGTINGVSRGYGTLLIQAGTSARNVDIYSAVGSTNPINSISVTQVGGSTITFHGNVTANGDIDASDSGSTVNFSGNVTSSSGSFSTSSSNFNVITGDVTVDGSVTLGGNASFGGDVTAGDVNIDGHTLTMTGAKTISGNLRTTGNSGTGGTFAINGSNVTLAGDVGGNGNSLTAINLASNNTLTINTTGSALSIYAPITTGTSGKGTVSFAGANKATLYGNVGSFIKALAAINLGSDVTFSSTATSVYANDISHTNSVLDLSAHDVSMVGNYSGIDSTVTLGEKKLTITGGTVTLAGAIVINATYTAEDQIMIDLSNATSMDASGVTSLTLNIDNNELTPTSNSMITVINAPMDVTIPTITASLGTSDPKWKMLTFGVLTYDPPAASAPIIKSVSVLTSGFTPVGASSQNVEQAALRLGGATQINDSGVVTFKINSLTSAPYLALVTPDASLPNSQVSIGSGNTANVSSSVSAYTNQFSTVGEKKGALAIIGQTVNANPGIVLDQSTIQIVGILAGDSGMISPNLARIMTESSLSGSALSIIMQDIGKMIPTEGTEAVNRLVSRVTAAPANTNQIVMNNVSTRMMSTSGSLLFAGVDNAEGIVVANNENPGDDFREVAQGIAAGSNAYDKYGVWLSAHAGKALQKDYKGEAGFKSHAEGFSLGVDTMISERTSIGAAVSNSFDHIKYRNSGNKTDTSSWVGAIYGNHKLKNNWFIKGTALFNRTRMNSKDLRVIYGGYGTAHAKYNLISYGGEAAVGFMHHFKNDLMLVPTIGFRVLHNNKSNFGQYGNTYQNNTLSTNAINNYSALGGLSLSKNFVEYGIIFTPEAHVNVQYGINQQTPKGTFVSALTPNQPTNFIGTKSNKITSIYGLGLTGSSDRIEVGITGDVTIANRYVGYQGSLKVKVMF